MPEMWHTRRWPALDLFPRVLTSCEGYGSPAPQFWGVRDANEAVAFTEPPGAATPLTTHDSRLTTHDSPPEVPC